MLSGYYSTVVTDKILPIPADQFIWSGHLLFTLTVSVIKVYNFSNVWGFCCVILSRC
jgi:hypothetical protein